MKKSFILHIDSLDVLDELSDEQAGKIFRAIKDFHNNKEVKLDGILKAIFIPFKNQLQRDQEKYDAICERNRLNGAKGGRPTKKTQKTQSVILGTQKNPKKPKKAHSKNDSDSKNDNNKSPTEIKKDSYGNEKINNMLIALKGAIGITEFADSQKWSRIYARHCVNLVDSIGPKEFRRRLDIILEDSFKRKNCNKIKYVYNEIKGFIEPKTNPSKYIFN